MHRGYLDLLKPLENFQTAPIGFLFAVEFFSGIFGFGEKALRFFPFLISILSIPFFYHAIKGITQNRLTSLLCFFIYAITNSLIYFSNELKPYTIDISAFIFLIYLLTSNHSFVSKHRKLLLSIVGALFLLMSNATIVILCTAGAYIIYDAIQKKSLKESYLLVFMIWLGVFILQYVFFILDHPYQDGMANIWAFTFPPTDLFSPEFTAYRNNRLEEVFFTHLLFFHADFYFKYFLLLAVFFATVHMISNKKYSLLIFTWLPICLHFALAYYKIYPFYYRFILYLLPSLLIIIAYGFGLISSWLYRKANFPLALAFVLFVLLQTSRANLSKIGDQDRDFSGIIDKINDNYKENQILITTPWTLYRYYVETNRIQNHTGIAIPWSIDYSTYKKIPGDRNLQDDYVLLHASVSSVDGYENVLETLNRENLILEKLDSGSYALSFLKLPPSVVDSLSDDGQP
ncbi:MAG: glycosyltransferase family 39 protein [Flavobacteriales bacterium]|nr:glycosyltransferase family 39 protein [Flavobacteriales bacterium]